MNTNFTERTPKMQGTQITLPVPGLPAATDQFWYWQGASGRKYIHSVYDPETCPPLPGAVYLAIRRSGNQRSVIATGHLQRFPGHQAISRQWAELKAAGADEIHVHLLAKSPEKAGEVLADLRAALEEDGAPSTFKMISDFVFGRNVEHRSVELRSASYALN
jgi:hypothetical protein